MARGGSGSSKGGAKGKSGAPVPRDVTVSKKLAWLLRHGAEKEGLELGKGGYANLGDVLRNRNIRSLQPPPTLPEIKSLVAENAKQRFSLIHITEAATTESEPDPATSSTKSNTDIEADTDPSNFLIRANQGHSLKLESGAEGLLKPITAESGNVPLMTVHGTRREHWGKIVQSGGLKPMGRNHVHFTTGLPASFKTTFGKSKASSSSSSAKDPGVEVLEGEDDDTQRPAVVSGMRETSTVLMFLDIQKALEKGLKFFLSDNGVVLCEGNEEGIIPLELFERVEDRDGKVLLDGGVLVESAQVKGRAGKEKDRRVTPLGPLHQSLPYRDKKPEDSARAGE